MEMVCQGDATQRPLFTSLHVEFGRSSRTWNPILCEPTGSETVDCGHAGLRDAPTPSSGPPGSRAILSSAGYWLAPSLCGKDRHTHSHTQRAKKNCPACTVQNR